jgi:hypothetical protein
MAGAEMSKMKSLLTISFSLPELFRADVIATYELQCLEYTKFLLLESSRQPMQEHDI